MHSAIFGLLYYGGICYNKGVLLERRYALPPLPPIIQNFAFWTNCDYHENRKAVFYLNSCNYPKPKFCTLARI